MLVFFYLEPLYLGLPSGRGSSHSEDLPQRPQNRNNFISTWTVISLPKESSWPIILLTLYGEVGFWTLQMLDSQWNHRILPFIKKSIHILQAENKSYLGCRGSHSKWPKWLMVSFIIYISYEFQGNLWNGKRNILLFHFLRRCLRLCWKVTWVWGRDIS